MRPGRWDRAHGFAVISEAVWWVTMVDAALMRYHPDIYSDVLARQDAAERRMTKGRLRRAAVRAELDRLRRRPRGLHPVA